MPRLPKLQESRVLCLMPWTSMSIDPDGTVYPCCRADKSASALGTLRAETLREVWNGEGLRRLRRDMIAGRESPACADCYELERVGVPSLRQSSNAKFAHHADEVGATAPDGSVGRWHLPLADVRFSNLCNFRCRTCNSDFSSAWHREERILARGFPSFQRGRSQALVRATRRPGEVWEQLREILPTIETLRFQGGESLLTEEHYLLLKALLDGKMTHVHLEYSTNLSVTRYRDLDFLDAWSRFDFVRIGASLDASAARGEYLRKGQRWDEVVRTRERMLRACPRVLFHLTPTLSAMNALHLPDFHREWIERGLVEANDIQLNVLRGPEEYRVQILPSVLKAQMADRYERHVREVLLPWGEATEKAREQFRAAVRFAQERDRTDLLPRFRGLTRRLDELRGERFEAAFPEMASLMTEA